jgi:acetylornithine deacetylase/succinyl-diaminopimelate desuccinylase-like protein
VTKIASSVGAGLEPATFLEHFEALTRIARPSRHEAPAIEHVHLWAGEHGFEVEQDEGRNVVIRIPAPTGRESAPTVVVQGHLDALEYAPVFAVDDGPKVGGVGGTSTEERRLP